MAKVRLEFLPSLAETLGIEQMSEDVLPNVETGGSSSLVALLNRLGAKYRLFGQIVFNIQTQQLTGGVAIFLNERSVETGTGLETRLRDGDKLTFVPVIEGG
ncbi:MAG: hypothetical protein HW402_543 [Dehalococcoidales bacterium]|nr:hypothetical protein [Dehalococcoidales bacterium]